MSCNNGMITFWYEHYIIRSRNCDLIYGSIRRINLLNRKSLRLVNLIKVGLFQISFQQFSLVVNKTLVVFMCRKRAPVTGGSIHFNSNQPVARESRTYEII